MHHLPSRYIPCDGRLTATAYFNPRSPHGERPNLLLTKELPNLFQSTLPAWGATGGMVRRKREPEISIHAPRMGSDIVTTAAASNVLYFNPRSPHGERQKSASELCPFGHFNPRSPHGERLSSEFGRVASFAISIHAPRMGSDSTVKAYSNDRIKWSTLREPHFLYSKNACFSPIVSMCAATSRTKNQRIRVSFGSYPGLAPTCFTLDWYRFPRL